MPQLVKHLPSAQVIPRVLGLSLVSGFSPCLYSLSCCQINKILKTTEQNQNQPPCQNQQKTSPNKQKTLMCNQGVKGAPYPRAVRKNVLKFLNFTSYQGKTQPPPVFPVKVGVNRFMDTSHKNDIDSERKPGVVCQ